ncbi:MAG: GNAT family protein [Candidatus Gracilibacteria bacterium]|jgi:RimJ/RimL family protein N-acetyltransferase
MQIKGDKIILCAITSSDKDYFYTIATKSYGAKFWYDDIKREKRSKTAFFNDWAEGYFDPKKPKEGQCFWMIAQEKKIGVIAYNKIDENNNAEIDIIIADEEDMNKGYGTDAIKTLCEFLLKKLKVNKVWIEARMNNPRAIKAYQKAGFKKEKILEKKDFFQGEFVDCIRLEMP